MTIVNTPVTPIVVDTSKSLEVQALAINAAANQLRTTIAGVWDLAPTTPQPPAPDSTVVLKRVLPGQESVLDGDERTLVAEEHYAPGGKYRGIIKLMIKYAQKPNSMAHGTGWLIRPDLIATAGHNVYDWGHNAGQAIEIKCYAGWSGASRINESVEFRRASRVVTTERWLQTRGSKAHDFALIQVEKPFTNVTPFSKRREWRIEMYVSGQYNLEKQPDTMLEYSVDTEGGQSGSPVLLENGLVAIGAHVYGGSLNAGSVLGRYGNPIQDYIAAVDIKLAHPGQINLFTIADDVVAAKGAATAKQSNTALTQLEGGDHIGTSNATNGPGPKPQTQESIFDSIADVLKITSRAHFLLGPIGGTLADTALLALNGARAASAESGWEGGRALPLADLQRAQLARALYMKLMKDKAKANPEGFFDDLASTITQTITGPVVSATTSVVDSVTSGLVGGAKAYEDAVRSLFPTVAHSFVLAAALPVGAVNTESAMESDAPDNEKRFMAAFAESRRARRAQKTGGSNSEGFFDDVIIAGVVNAFAGGSSKAEGWFVNAVSKADGSGNLQPNYYNGYRKSEGFWDDITQPFKDAASAVGDAASNVANTVGDAANGVVNTVGDAANSVANTVEDTANKVGNTIVDGANKVGNAAENAANAAANAVTGAVINPVVQGVNWVLPIAVRAESSIEETAGFQEGIIRITQAFVLRAALEEQYLVATMARPLEELKAEGWWDDMNEAIEGAVTGTATWAWDQVQSGARRQMESDQRQMDAAGARIVTPMNW
ncbi:hypothetical protein CB0940_07333 [Cercospora beticola]|uniref:Serine protease n=1 Tax=Cercospora beticola TaxID=122368 RepID=A0A2G5H7E5_CERBT|nr:hypothetical protein CB0940_07333 [Cercospora beticola]PIA88451.1 hypothetical protein CB0940_07333 [Cercospora beticola]WPB03272.1 hypothetical protein RHO25_007909 [Cercospora beticola]